MSKLRDKNQALLFLKERFVAVSQNPGINNYEPYTDEISGQSPQKTFHSSPARGRLFVGGNRSGKTVGGGAETVMWMTGMHKFRKVPPPPVRMRACGVDFKNGIQKIMLPEIKKWVPPSFLTNGSWEDSYNKEFKTLTLNNGSFVEFMSYDQETDAHAGTSRHGVWFDEEPPEAIFDENMQRLVDTKGEWWMTMTPVEGMTWVFDEIYEPGIDGSDPSIFVVEVDTTMNPYIDQEARQEILRGLTPDEMKARTEGKFISRGGVIYPMFSKEKHVIEPFTPPKEWMWANGMDHGFHNPTAWLWSAIDRDGRIFIFDEHYASGLIVREHAKLVHQKNSFYARIPNYNVGDPSIRNTDPITGTSILIEYLESGLPIILGNNDQKAGIQRIARQLTGTKGPDGVDVPRLYITANCVNLIREMARLRWATWANKKDEKSKNAKEEQHKKDDHAADALRYLVASRPEDSDNGTEIPQNPANMKVPSSRAVDPDEDFNDWGLERRAPRGRDYAEMADDMMGAEW